MMATDAAEACFVGETLGWFRGEMGKEAKGCIQRRLLVEAKHAISPKNNPDRVSRWSEGTGSSLGEVETSVEGRVTPTVHGSRPNPDNDATVGGHVCEVSTNPSASRHRSARSGDPDPGDEKRRIRQAGRLSPLHPNTGNCL